MGAAWRVHKCRFKKRHYYKYKDDKTRWLHRSKTVPEDHFLKLLSKWKKTSEKNRCSRNRERRLAQRNMHTAGPKSFACIREEMKHKNPDKKPPSLAELFEQTRKRKEGNLYKESYEDTTKKIEAMKSYVPDDNGSGSTDPFLAVMGKEFSGRRRLFGRGVCNKKLKQVNAAPSSSYLVPGEVLVSLKSSLAEDLRKDADSEMNRVETFFKELEEEHLKKKEYLENMEKNLENQREAMTQQIMKTIMEKLPEEVARRYLH
ncbi:uncharacterized protein LOC141646043 [Silene latifolia]|uniref:uncharacterized protein LOC141646043 n=1 Tax=Silene latifolia TaxID=37657 RepID=UPI003D77A6A9